MATYEIYYTQTAEQDILEKFSYILHQFRDPTLAETWYTRLREAIQSNLSEFPEKYPMYNVVPWNERLTAIFPANTGLASVPITSLNG